MKTHFAVEAIKFKTINVLPNSWTTDDFKNILELVEYGDASDLSDKEVEEMCLLSLADLEPEESAEIVLKYLFKDQLNDGQIQNLSHEIQNEKTWEEYADLSMHETFFNAGQLLYKAYNGKFAHPEAVQFVVKLSTKQRPALQLFDKNAEQTLIRVLAQGMPDNTLLKRLFDDQLADDGDFKEAKDILWQLKETERTDTAVTFDIVSSHCWFDDFRYVETFEADLEAHV